MSLNVYLIGNDPLDIVDGKYDDARVSVVGDVSEIATPT
jgi:hypothetical protein